MIEAFMEWMITNPLDTVALLMVEYAIIMHIYMKTGKAPWVKYTLGLVFYIQDVFVNVVILTFLFLDAPQEYTVTSRIKRYTRLKIGVNSKTRDIWRHKVGGLLCDYANWVSPGHC